MTRSWLGERSASAALPFAEAVTLQLSGREGADGAQLEIARRVVGLLREPGAADAPARLAADPALLASFFQNVDLLYEHAFADADAVSLLVMRAMEVLEPSD